MALFVILVGLLATATAVPVPQIPLLSTSNGVLTLLPVNGLGSSAQQFFILQPSDLAQFNSGLVAKSNEGTIAVSAVQPPVAPQAVAAVQVAATTQIPPVKAVPASTQKPVVVEAPTTKKAPAATKITSDNDNAADGNYNYVYEISDPVTGDAKKVSEVRNGDVVKGSYTVNDPDGFLRTVEYTADPVNGFQATVTRTALKN